MFNLKQIHDMSLNFYNTKIGNYFKTLKNRKRKNLLKMRGEGQERI